MPISEKDIFATLMQDPNHAYNPIEKVWAEAQQRARQFRNNEKALSLAFDDSPALEKLLSYLQKAEPRINPSDTPDDFGERLKENLDAYQEFEAAAFELNRLYEGWDAVDGKFDAGQTIRMGGNIISLENFNTLLQVAHPAFEGIISLVQELDENSELTYADAIQGKPELQKFIDSWIRDNGNISPRLTKGLENYQNDDFVKSNNVEAEAMLSGESEEDRIARQRRQVQEQASEQQAGAGERDESFADAPEEEEPDTTYDEFHPAEEESYPLDKLDPEDEGHSIHSVMLHLLNQYGHTDPVSGTDRQGRAIEQYYEIINKDHEKWLNTTKDGNRVVKLPPEIIKLKGGPGNTFDKLKIAGLVKGNPTGGKWEWEEGTEALQELIKNMDRVSHVTTRDGKIVSRLTGELHPALVDWLIDANTKGKLAPTYTEQDAVAHVNQEVAPGVQASPVIENGGTLPPDRQDDYDESHINWDAAVQRFTAEELEELEIADAAEGEDEDEAEEEGSEEEGENPWLTYENPPSTGLIQSTGENWLTPPVVEQPTNEQVEESINNAQDSTHPQARFFPRGPSGTDKVKPYLLPRINGQDFNPLKVDGNPNPDGEDASIDEVEDNFKTILQNFHAMNYKNNPDSLPSKFGVYNPGEITEEFPEGINGPNWYELTPETWDENKKLAYNEMRDNLGLHEGWLHGLLKGGMVPEQSDSVIYDPTTTHGEYHRNTGEGWNDKGIKKGHWNWVEALRGLGILDTAGYPKFSSIDHSEGNLDRTEGGHGLDFVGVARTGGRRRTGGGEVEGGGSFHTALNHLLTSEGISTPEQPYWAEAEQERKQAFMGEFGGTPSAAEAAWDIYQTSKGHPTGRMAGPSEQEPYRPDEPDESDEDSEGFHDFIQNILAEGHLGQTPEQVRESIFGSVATTEDTDAPAEEVPAAEAVVPDAGPVEGGLGLESEDWGQAPTPLGEPEPVLTPEEQATAQARQDQIDLATAQAAAERARLAKLKAEKIDKLMAAYPGAEEHKADHQNELETNDKFLETEWANEIKRRQAAGIKAQANAEKEEAQTAKEDEKEANKPTPMDGSERKRLIQQIVDASKILHPGLEMSAEKQQLLEYISEHDEKGFRAEHAKIVNALETKQQADAKLHRTRDANNLDGFHGLKPLSSQQQPTEDDLIMQIRRIERWRKEHGADMSEVSNQKLEGYWNEVNQFAANIGFDVDDQVNKDKEEANQVGENHYGSSDWLDEVGKMHVDELGRKGNYDKQIAQGAALRGNRNYKPWLVIKYDRNGFGTFHDLRQRDENGDYGMQISPESLSFNEDEQYFDYKEEKEDLSQHPRAFDRFWNKIDRANFRPIDRRGFVERHGESGITSDTSGDRGEQTGWYHPESGSWVNPHRYREVRQALAQSGPGAGMMILNGSQFTGNHKRDGDDVHPKYGFAHRGDKTLADAGDDTNDFSYYVDGDGNIAHANADWDTVKQRDTNQIQDVNSVVHDWHSQNMNNMVRQDPASWKSSDGQSVLPGKIIQPRQGGEAPLQNMRLLKDVKEFDALARRRKQAGYDPSRMKNVGKTGLSADELGGMGQWWGPGAEARQKAFSALDYVGSGVLGFFGEMILGGKSKTDRMIQRARKQYKLHTEAESRTKDVMDNIKWHGQSVRYLSPGEGDARKEDLQRLRNHLSQQRVKHRNLQTEADTRKDTAGSQHSKEQQLKYSNDLNSLTGLDHELDSHWKHINSLYGNHMGGEQVHASMTPNVAEGSGAWADIFSQPSQQSEGPQEFVSSGLIGNAPGASGEPSISGGAGLIGGSAQENAPSREQIPSGVGLIG